MEHPLKVPNERSGVFLPEAQDHAARARELIETLAHAKETGDALRRTQADRSRLALSPTWRETATPATAARFEALLRELADDAKSWSAADILSATER